MSKSCISIVYHTGYIHVSIYTDDTLSINVYIYVTNGDVVVYSLSPAPSFHHPIEGGQFAAGVALP